MAQDGITLMFRLAGTTVSLTSFERIRTAIARRDLTAMTQIMVERDDTEIYAGPAKGFDQLAGLFEPDVAPEIVQRALAETSELRPPSLAAPSVPTTLRVNEVAQSVDAAAGDAPIATPPKPVRPGPKAAKRGGSGCVIFILVGVVAIFLLSRCGAFSAPEATRYARIDQFVHESAGGPAVGNVTRSTPIEISLNSRASQQPWVQISEGPFDGRWIYEDWLDEEPRPVLSGGSSAARITGDGVRVREEPSEDGTVFGALGRGESVEVLGETSNGWVEVRNQHRGVGYVWSSYVRTDSSRRR